MNTTIMQSKIYDMLYEDKSSIFLIKDRYITNEMWEYVLNSEPDLLKSINKPSLYLVKYAITLKGELLKYVKKKLKYVRIDKELLMLAIPTYPRIILDFENILDNTIKQMAIDLDSTLLGYYDDLPNEYIENKIKENPANIKFIYEPEEDLVCSAIKDDPNVSLYFEHLTDRMIQVLRKYHPNYLKLRQ